MGLERVGAVHGKKTLGLVEVAVHSNISAGMGEMLVAAFFFCHLYGHKTFKLKILILFLGYTNGITILIINLSKDKSSHGRRILTN